MIDEVEDFFGEFDDLAGEVLKSRERYLPQNLSRWFNALRSGPNDITERIQWLLSLTTWKELEENYLEPGDDIAQGYVNWPEDQAKRLSAQLVLFHKIASQEVSADDFGFTYYASLADINRSVQALLEHAFAPFANELRRYLQRSVEKPIPYDFAPASDRIVTLDHNSPDYSEAIDTLVAVEEALKGVNDYDDQLDKEQRIAELAAGRRLLKAAQVRASALLAVIYRALQYIAQKFVEVTIGSLALSALTKIGNLTGLW